MDAAYSDPPAVVRQADEPVLNALALPGSDMESAQRAALSRLSSSLSLESSSRLTPFITAAAIKEASTLKEFLARQNSHQGNFYPLGTTPGRYENKEGNLIYRIAKDTPLIGIVCKLTQLHDPALLTSADIDELIATNTSQPQVLNGLQTLRQLVEQKAAGTSVNLESVQAPASMIVAPSKGDRATFSALQTRSSLELAVKILNDPSITISAATRTELLEKKATLDVTLLFLDTSAVRWSTQVNAVTALFRAAQGNARPFLMTEGRIKQELQPISKLSETATRIFEESKSSGRTELLTEKQRDQIVAIAYQCRNQFLDARVEASLASAWLATASEHHTTSLQHYADALLYGNLRHNDDPPERATRWKKSRENILEQVRNYAAAQAITFTPARAGDSFNQLEQSLSSFFPRAEQLVVVAQSIVAARRSLLAEEPTAATLRAIRLYEQLEASRWRLCLNELGINLTASAQKPAPINHLTRSERELAHMALSGLLVGALELNDRSLRADIATQLAALRSVEPDLAVAEKWRLDTTVTVAGYAFEHPERFVNDPALLGIELPPNHTPLDLTRRLLDAVSTIHTQCIEGVAKAEREGEIEGRSAQIELLEQRCLAVLNHGLEEAMVAAHSSSEKQALYQQLVSLNDVTRDREAAAIQQFEQELLALNARIEADSAQATTSTTVLLRQRAAHLESQISRWKRSIALTSVVQARAALRANDPELTRKARAAIDSIPTSVLTSPSGQKLLDTFRSQHESQKLIAGCKQFLSESVRDNPLTTLLLMIGAGLSGASLAWASRRTPSSGFMLASSVLLGATKAYLLFTGAERIAASYATGLSYSTPFLSGLDVVYLATDVAQALLMIQALRALYGEKQSSQRMEPLSFPAMKDVSTFVKTEAVALARLARSQANIFSPGLWLVGIPVTAGIYQIVNSPIRYEEQLQQGFAMGSQILQILTVALLHDSIMNRKNRGPEDETEMTSTHSPLSPSPNLPATDDTTDN